MEAITAVAPRAAGLITALKMQEAAAV